MISKTHVANMCWPKATLLVTYLLLEQSFVFAADFRILAAILHLQTIKASKKALDSDPLSLKGFRLWTKKKSYLRHL